MQGSQVDKFMLYDKQGLRGAAVHAYRDEARSSNKHYGAGLKHARHIHENRILLKAQPQQGKTGDLWFRLHDGCMSATNNDFWPDQLCLVACTAQIHPHLAVDS